MVDALAVRGQVLRPRVLRSVLSLPRGNRLGSSHHAPHYRRKGHGCRIWTICSPSPRDMEGKTICVFADAAAWPVQSYITKFRAEFEEHIRTGDACVRASQQVDGSSLHAHLTIDGREVERPRGHHGHPGCGEARDLHPALLLPPGALHRRKLPHLPGGGGEESPSSRSPATRR